MGGSIVSRLPARDLADLSERNDADWRALAGARVLVTGAAGFVGSWMLEALLHAAAERDLDVAITALVRDRPAFQSRFPHLANDALLTIISGDVRRLSLDQAATHIVHAASATSPDRHALDPGDIIDTIRSGTRRVLELASPACRTLIVSSGSVYDRARVESPRISEDHATIAEAQTLAQRFGVAKRQAERMAEDAGMHASIARIFTVVGPRLPLGGQFAVGQFLGDALAGRGIRLTGDGSPVRSYLYSADLASWLWAILLRGSAGRAYNIGSEEEIAIGDVAERVARLRSPRLDVMRGPSAAANGIDRYVPDTRRAREELGLDAWTAFPEALNRTWAWLRAGST